MSLDFLSPQVMENINRFMPIALITLIFIVFIFRPQYKKINEHKKMISALKSGDKILTQTGLIGKIIDMKDGSDIVGIEISNGVTIDIIKTSIISIYKMPAPELQ